jgi:hypothetical protein
MVQRGSPVAISEVVHENSSFRIRDTVHNIYYFSSKARLASALDGVEWSKLHPGRFTSGEDPVPIVQEAGWAPGPVWTGVENLPPQGFE